MGLKIFPLQSGRFDYGGWGLKKKQPLAVLRDKGGNGRCPLDRVSWGRSLGIFIYIPKNKELVVKRSTFLFFHWNRKNKTDDPVIISSLAFIQETKV